MLSKIDETISVLSHLIVGTGKFKTASVKTRDKRRNEFFSGAEGHIQKLCGQLDVSSLCVSSSANLQRCTNVIFEAVLSLSQGFLKGYEIGLLMFSPFQFFRLVLSRTFGTAVQSSLLHHPRR